MNTDHAIVGRNALLEYSSRSVFRSIKTGGERLFHDLDLYGDDFDDFIDFLHKTKNVDFTYMDGKKYCPSESMMHFRKILFLFIFEKYFRSDSFYERFVPLTVRDIGEAISKGQFIPNS